MKVKVLGTEYEILTRTAEDDAILDTRDGYCDTSVKKIIISNLRPQSDSKLDLRVVRNNIIRHEIIHAFLYESGLDVNSEWGSDETLVDWIALQFPKMAEAFEAAGCSGGTNDEEKGDKIQATQDCENHGWRL
jgi:hypothetical protein